MDVIEKSTFFAMLSRMKTIRRWSLMRNIEPENIMEHSFQVAIIAHSLALLHNEIALERKADVGKVAILALYHDANEVITGDMPTPIKYHNPKIRDAFHEIEHLAAERLLGTLPKGMKESFERAMFPQRGEELEQMLVKAADKISAYLKCVEERRAGNLEFAHAERALLKEVHKYELPVVMKWMGTFADAFELSLDEIS